FEAPTVARLAAAVAGGNGGIAGAAPPIVPVPRDGPLPLSFAQRRLWLIDQVEPGSAVYNIPAALRMRGALDAGVLERSLAEVVRRHEVLRTVFRGGDDGEAAQVVLPAGPVALRRVDLTVLPAREREARLPEVARAEASAPFDLGRGPLLRATLVLLADGDAALLFTVHHIVSDEWSTEILVREVSALYGAFGRGEESHLPELPVQYADFAAWQRARLRDDVLEPELDFWRGRLGGAPPLLELPTDRPRTAAADPRGGVRRFALPAETAAALRTLAAEEAATPFMALLAGFQALLARWSGQDDVVVGTPAAGRGRAETEELIGFFVDTLVLRGELSPATTGRELLRQARERVLEAQAHGDVPFERLVEELAPGRATGHAPLFQVMFTLETLRAGAALRLGGVEVEPLEVDAEPAKFDLTLELADEGERITGRAVYRTALFDAATVDRLVEHYLRLLAGIAAEPDARVGDLALAGEAERRRVLEEWNATARPFPDRPLHERFAEQAARTPGAAALRFAGHTTTYAELARGASRLARRLRALGVGPEVRVGLCMERTPGVVAAMLAVLEAGGAYVPLDPEYPAERVAHMLADSGAAVLLTEEHLLATLPEFGGEIVLVDREDEHVEDADALSHSTSPDSLAYLIYTSGSTGTPKGVAVPHRALASQIAWMQRAFPLAAADRVLQRTPFSFDASVWEFWAPLAAGATLVMPEPGEHREPARLAAVMAAEGVTVAQFVPTLLGALLEEELSACTAVRRVFAGGEALPAELAARARAALGAEVVNLYGPTEVCINATAHTFAADGGATVPIGRPVDNVRAYVLDRNGEPAATGVPGELYLGGVQLARGYLGRPGLTAGSFVPDGLSGEAGGRLYRTGDRVRWLAGGALEFLGRTDQQVKLRGFRIEPGEVEAALRAHPAVRDAVVVARDAAGGARLVAYLVPADGAGEPDAGELRAFLRGRLPDYMVPSALVALAALPLTPSGKVDRGALPEPAAADGAGARYVAPRTPAEDVLAGIWAEVLGVERVGVEDGFFDLGGHSLLATRVVSRARAALGVELPVRALFEAPTVAGLAARAEALRLEGDGVRVPPVVPVPRGRPLPLSFSQERLWFLDRLEPGNAHYNIAAALRLRGPLRAEVLRVALEDVTRRHEALRTVFAERGGGPVQVVLPAGRFHLPVHDLSALPGAERERAMLRLVHDEAGGGFDLLTGPLLRVRLVRLAPEEHVLVLTMHHVVSDAWSMDVLWREAARCYAARAAGASCPLPPLSVQYADFAVWQREALAGEALDAQAGWWRAALEGAPALLALPTDRPRPAAWSHRAGEHPFAVSAGVSEALRALGRHEGATLFMTLLAALQVVLGRFSGQDDVVVGTPVAGRTRAETEGLIGFFVNQLALRGDLSGDPTFAALLGRVREATLGAYAHQELPFERLLEALRVERTAAHASVYQVMMVLHAARGDAVALPGVEVAQVPVHSAAAAVDLEIAFRDTPGGVLGTVVYAAGLYDRATVAALADHLVMVLEEAASDPGLRLSELSPLTPEERRTVLGEWTRTARPFPEELGAHELFARQAARTPDAVAVAAGDRELTYAELDRRVEALARLLRARGAGPESRVAVCMERAPEMLVAILGALRAGAAFVPMDPANPRERLARVLADSGAALLLTQRRLLAALPAAGVEAIVLDGDWESEVPEGGPPAPARVDPRGAAYVVYTSGSTGTPKGVVVEHRSLVNHATAAAAEYGIGPRDRVLQFASPAFDASLEEIFPALASGAALVLRDEESLAGVPAFLAWCAARGITVLDLPTAFWHELAAELERGGAALPESVRLVIIGGERALPERMAAWHAAVGGAARLVNTYGPTEATVVATLADLAPEDGAEEGAALAAVSIGRPVANARAYLLDAIGRPVPPGARGELYLGGAGVARGYLGRPALTAEKFVPDPFSGEAGARLFRTGDLARFRRGGELEFAGRADGQVKVRGFRVEPGEVEAALARLPGVREAVVAAREDEPGAVRLVAYVVPEAEGAATAEALRAGVRAALPEYMVPAAWVLLDRLPLTPTGKLDRRALPAPDAPAAAEHVPPRTPTERAVAEIWASVLRVERVGATDDFFALGGHSLLAQRVVSRVREALGVELPLRALMEEPTVAAVAERVDALPRTVRARERGGAAAAGDGPVPLSFAQQRLWFVQQLYPESAAYNMPAALRLSGRVEVATLERCLGEVVRRHEALRTVFPDAGGEPEQRVLPPRPARIPVADLRRLEPDRRGAEARCRAADEALRPFVLERGPLLRSALLRLADEEWMLLFTMHHVVSDGWSMGVLVREVSALYEAFSRGASSPLPELPLQYPAYAVWQRRHLAGEALERQVAWWRAALAGAPPALDLPTDRPRPAIPGERGDSTAFWLSPATSRAVDALARAEGVTPFMVLLAAWQALLGRWAGQEDVVVGTPAAGRDRVELEPLIGFFVNTLALRADLSGRPSLRALAGRVREFVLGAFAHQDVPFERLVEELAPGRSLSHTPLFQVVFTLGELEGALRLGAVRMESVPPAAEPARFDLGLAMEVVDGRYAGSLAFRADLFDAATARRMAGHFVRLLDAAAADPDRPLADVDLMDEAERRRVLEEWNPAGRRPYPREACIHELFEAQVRARPGAAALVWEGVELTYAQLDARANRLAHHLRGLGVAPESRVGVLLERGPELIVAILAVLKAGGCYVPLDPGYPAERLRMMLDDSGVRVLLGRGDVAFAAEAGDLSVVLLDEAAEAIAREPGEAPRGGATAENLAYIVYTSGSTGRPKGVMVAHRHVVQLAVETDYVRLGPGDRVAQASNASFDALAFEAWGALMNGATLVGIPRDVLLAPAALRDVLREQRITTLYQTTALLNQLSREQPDIFAPLREVLFGGQAADADSVRRLLEAGGPRRLLHMYGPTETTAWCSYEPVEHVAGDAATVPVGRATANQRIYLLDAALTLVPVGVPGEAYVGGDGVVRGYLDRPALTAGRFLPDPFAAEPGARMYRTGDRLRWTADGKLEFVGRVDEQVKVRGFRIEPGEIEAVLCAHAEVREARVIVREDPAFGMPGEQRLVAYLVGGADADAVRDHLRRSLPEYMVPGGFVAMESFPLTPNGKLDVRALPAPEYGAGAEHVAPRTPTEELLAGIWAEVLGLERVGVEASFFELGGHSLLATQVVARARFAFGVELPLRALFEAPTVAALAGRVEALLADGEGTQAPPLVALPRDGAPLPLSFAQQRLWFLDRLAPGSAAYAMPFALRLRGPLDARALERGLAELVRRHETLRTVLVPLPGGGAAQSILPPAPPPLPRVDLAGLPAPAREAETRRLAAADSARPFDLERGPLLRATRIRLAADEHVLLFALHHVVSDGWSMGVLVAEVSALYEAFARGEPSPLPELEVQYADFAAWQRRWLDGEVLARQLDYWRGRLAGAPPVLTLPTDRPRPAVPGERGDHRALEVPAEVARGLRALARREGATLFAVLLAAWQLLLARWADEDDVVVGSPVANRTRLELEPLIGFFVNTLALRTDLSGDPTLRELVGRARETVLGAQAHQDLPFERLVEEVAPERSLDHSPLFQVAFALQNTERAELRMGPLAVASLDAGPEPAKFDLSLTLAEEGDRLEGVLAFRAELFDAATAERLLERFGGVLALLADDPEHRVSGFDLLLPAERALLRAEWDASARPRPASPPVHELAAAHARRAPDAPALVAAAGTLTYGALLRRADALAARLRALGVGVEARVALCLERGPELAVAALAVVRAGAAYVPIDPAYPAERIAFLLADSAAAAVLTTAALAVRVQAFPGEIVVVDENDDAEAQEALPQNWGRVAALRPPGGGPPADASAIPVDPDNAAYVVYTSGSTGRPKGVVVTHGALLNLVRWHLDAFGVTAADRATLLAGPGFDASVWELWPYLAAGAALHPVEDEDTRTGPVALRDFMLARGVTIAFAPTPLAEGLLGVEWPADAPLRTLLTGGDALRARPAPGLPFALVNDYGPTETAVVATSGPVDPAGDGAGAPDVGRAIDNARTYVLDRWLHPAPPGVPGELCVGGAGVARGYLGRPELTAERFLPDPFTGEPGARMYRTGDRVRRLAGGRFEFLGRADAQVKIRGIRVEPGEVEAVLAAAPGVREAAVTVRRGGAGEARLAGYVAAREGAEVAPAGLREWLRARLPEHMVPSTLTVLDALPLTANGKLDRGALPAPIGEEDGRTRAAPRTPTEEVLAGIWAEVLELDRVGTHTGFFDLGGHSLLATRVVSRIREAFGVELPLRVLFEAPTVAGLAARVDAAAREGGRVQAPPLLPVPRDGAPLPLSFAQQRLWFIDQLEPGSAAYNVPQGMRLRGPLEVGVLRRALQEIVRRHESLRTTLRRVEGRPVQVVAAHARARLPEIDLRALDAAAREAEARRIAAADAERPFDLARGPLLRTSVVRLGDADFALLLNMHHVVSDGWSMEVLVRELSALYDAFRAGKPSPLAPLPVQYADFAAWQRAWLDGPVLDRQLDFWRERLAGAPPVLELPTDRPRPRVPGEAAGSRSLTLPAGTSAALRALSRREGTTLFMTLLAAWQALLGRYAGRDDVVVGAPVAGRDRVEVEGLIGFFVNTLVMRADLSGEPDGRELLRRVREAALGAYAHADVPFERLVEEIVPARSLSHTPLFQATFSLQNADAARLRLGEGELEELDAGAGTAKFDLVFAMADDGERLGGTLAYRAELWDAATIARMLEHFGVLLGALAADPGRPVAELPLLPAAERRRVLEELNDPRRDYPAGLRVHDLFTAQARRTPGAPAIAFRGAAVTYAELEERSGRLASHLRGLGVRPETRVGICLERTPELVVAMLAVLRAGGAYVPLDPTYPRERLGYMQEDAGVSLVLTSGRLAGALPAGTRTLALDDVRAAVDAAPAEVPESGALPENLSHVIFTSGSTGRPKGVMIRHSSVVVLLHWLREAVSDEERSAALFSTSINFDVSVAEVFGTLAWGGRLVMVENALELATVAEPVVHASMVPTAAAELLRAGTIPPTVRTLNLGGEPLPADLARGLYALGTVKKVGNLYGPTEDTTYSTYFVAAPDGGPVLVGRPVANTAARVLDAGLEPVPVGVPGELYLAGDGLARGYAARPELTAERFLPDPFGPAGTRMYRVMDRVRWRADGQLEYFGRTDFQVKVRGFRIELGEIEAALRAHPAVAETVAVVREDAPGDRRIAAYLIPAAGAEAPPAGELRAWLRDRVPEYMVPSAFVALAELPLTPNGKLDRLALPAPGERAGAGREYVAPRTPTEEGVARAWAATLGIELVGAHDNFFDLGGHSLLLVQLHSRLQERFGAALSLAELFQHPTLADLARRIDELRDEPAAVEDERRRTLDRAEARRARMSRPRTGRAGGRGTAPDGGDGEEEP
ncbi:MAG: non-ribosomal peptide synthase/polyketide synthase, partial [Longimicrobiaceae bacterium]